MRPDAPDTPRVARARLRSEATMRAALERQLDPGSNTAAIPPPIPDHALLERIGSGAYGEVWLARSTLGTLRAVKIVYRARFDDDRPYEREFNGILKYEPVSRSHQGLVQVLHVGRHDAAGCFYYVMELADMVELRVGTEGELRVERLATHSPRDSQPATPAPPNYCPRTLRADLAHHQRFAPADAAQLVLRLVGALAHLHGQGLVHRDIKPSNVIFVEGQPKLADIGLVAGAGHSRSYVGTEGFVPPEGPGTGQADLYALGKLLYELATGRDRLEFPQLPPGLARLPEAEALLELNEVITRACAPNPQERYATAAELQADLSQFLAGRSLRQARRTERHLAWLKRLVGVACAGLVLAAVLLWLAKNAERRARDRALLSGERARVEGQLRARAEAAEHEARQQLYTALLEQARATVRSGELGQRVRALEAVRRAAAISNSSELRGVALSAFALPDLRLEHQLPADRQVTLAQWDPAFERIAWCRRSGPVEIRTASSQQLLATLPASTNLPAHAGTWRGDGRFLAVKRDRDAGGRRADLEVWQVDARRRVLLLHDVPWGAMSFHPQRDWFLAGQAGRAAVVWDLDQGEEISRFQLPADPIRLRCSADGERLAALYEFHGWTISIHSMADGASLAANTFGAYIGSIDWDATGRWIAAPDSSGMVHLMDAHSGQVRALGRHKAEAVTAIFSPDGGYLLSGGWERELICWNVPTMQHAFAIGLNAFRAQFSADGTRCAVLRDTDLQVHTFERPFQRELREDLGGRIRHAAFSPDNRWLAVSGDTALGIWDLTGNGSGALAPVAAEARLYFSSHNEVVAGRNSSVFRWRISPSSDPSAAPNLEPLDMVSDKGVTSVCTTSEGVAFTGAKGTKIVSHDHLDSGDGAWIPTSEGLNAVSPDQHWLLIYRPFTPIVHVYRLPDLQPVAALTNHANIRALRFSPTNVEVAVLAAEQIEFWSTTTWQRTRVWTNYMGFLFGLEARTCWLARDFRSAALCDAATLEPLLPLPAGIVPLALSPDARRLAVSVDARRVQVWDLLEVRERLRGLGLDWVPR